MKIIKETTVKKNVEDVWNVLGNQFGEAHLWSCNFKTSKPGGEAKFEGLSYSNRITETERGETIQELDEFDPHNYSLSYYISKGAPEIAKKAGATWSAEAINDSTTKVVFDFDMDLQDFVNEEMKAKVEMGLSKSTGELAEEFKYYLEEGKPHPRKLSSK